MSSACMLRVTIRNISTLLFPFLMPGAGVYVYSPHGTDEIAVSDRPGPPITIEIMCADTGSTFCMFLTAPSRLLCVAGCALPRTAPLAHKCMRLVHELPAFRPISDSHGSWHQPYIYMDTWRHGHKQGTIP